MVKPVRKKERGVALLAVIVSIALMTLIVVDFATSAEFGFMSAANQVNEVRAYYLGRSGISIGLALLAADLRATALAHSPLIDSLSKPWAAPYPSTSIDGGTASLSVVDEARKLNINALINPANGTVNLPAVQRMQRLFMILGLDEDILPALVEWVGPASLNYQGGPGGDFYMGLKPPYQPRSGPMPTIGDLAMVRGVDPVVFNHLRQFLTVMPEPGVNIDTAPPEVIASLDPALMDDPQLVKEIVAARAAGSFQQVTDFTNLLDPTVAGRIGQQGLTVQSQYFTISGMGTYAGIRKTVTAVFHREMTGIGTLASWQEE
jgi:general secretion pathway protein K